MRGYDNFRLSLVYTLPYSATTTGGHGQSGPGKACCRRSSVQSRVKRPHAVGMPSSGVEARFPADRPQFCRASSHLDLESLDADERRVLPYLREILASQLLLSRQDHLLR